MSLNHKADKEDVNIAFALQEKVTQERIRNLREELSRKEKFNVYTQRLVGELMEILIKKKMMTNQDAWIITTKAKQAVFTKEELSNMQSIITKEMQEGSK